MMSHEIRTPMNGILGMSQLLETTTLDTEQRDYLNDIRSSGDTLLILINDILDFSKVEAGQFNLEQRDFDLEEAIASTVALHRPLAERKSLALNYTMAPDMPTHVCGDRTRLRQVLSNLLANAIKFTAQGQVQMRASVRAGENERVVLDISVEDTGIGIPANRTDRLFKAFSQVDASTTRQFGGTGLGLAIAARLCQAMGGEIGVSSQVGKGSTFRFSVALGKASKAAPPPVVVNVLAELPPHLATSSPRVLVVDDDHINRTLALAMLKKLGLEAESAPCGEDAITRINSGGIDLVLMDLQMPGMDGVQTTHFIRGLDIRQPRIIALTANAFESDRLRCMEAGMDDFMAKPFRLAALQEKLSQMPELTD